MGQCFGTHDPEPRIRPSRYIVDKYIIGKTLGKGGSCRVVECTERATSQKYALKIMGAKSSINKGLFEKEIKILGMLDHPNIIKLKEFYVDPTSYNIVTDLCAGGELFDRIVDNKYTITEKVASKLIRTMLLAIEHCHKLQIVHRDIKPENFVFKTKAKDSDMVLIDFGCAKIVDDDQEYKDLLGTPYYLAPESAVGHRYIRTGRVLKSSDLWAIGVIAFIFMTGKPPFHGKTNEEIYVSIVKKPLKFPRKVELSEPFTDFCKKLLKKSPKRRLTLDEALQHPWIAGEGASSRKINEDVLRFLRQFTQQSKLKKAITKFLASQAVKKPNDQIREHFNRLDKNKDGGLDVEELAILLMDIGCSEVVAMKDAKAIIAETDDDRSGMIEFEEFSRIWQRKKLSEDNSYIHTVFQVLDENGNGKIEASELAKVLNLQGTENEEKIAEYIREVDNDGDGTISFKEFEAAMMENGELNRTGADVGHKFEAEEVIRTSNAIAGNFNLDQVEY